MGLGNPVLTDDGVGIRLARDLGREWARRPDLVVEPEGPAASLDLAEHMAGHRRVIVIDALGPGLPPGTVHVFTAAQLRESRHHRGIHDVNLATALELARRAGLPVPPDEEIHLFGVAVEDAWTFGEALSPALEEAYPRVREEVLEAVRALLEPASSV